MTRTQLDRLGERLKRGMPTTDDLAALAEFRNAFIPSTNTVADRLSSTVESRVRRSADITQRPAKSTPSIVDKLRRESSRLTQVQDIGGVRIVVSKVSVQNRVVELLKELYPDARVVDRREHPQHGYRAVHVIVDEGEKLVEVQVRTKIQNGWAQYSEKLADEHGQMIKYGRGPKLIMRNLKYLADYGASVERRETDLDNYKRDEINALNRLKRRGKMNRGDRERLEDYQRLRRQQREARMAMLLFFRREAKV